MHRWDQDFRVDGGSDGEQVEPPQEAAIRFQSAKTFYLINAGISCTVSAKALPLSHIGTKTFKKV